MGRDRSLLCALILFCSASSAANAGIAYTGISVEDQYFQSGAATPVEYGAAIGVQITTTGKNDFDSVSLSVPGLSSPVVSAYSPNLQFNGDYAQYLIFEEFDNISSLNNKYKFGTYRFTASNSATQSSQLTSEYYDANHWPSAIPALTATDYQALQNLNAKSAFNFSFNSFSADGYNPYPIVGVNPHTELVIYTSQGKLVYQSADLPDFATSLLLPANILEPGSTYYYGLDFYSSRHLGLGQPVGYFQDASYNTYGEFTTAAGTESPQTLVDFQGGTPENPVALPTVGQYGEVTGSIGGVGSTDFYKIFWGGGKFQATLSLSGASSDASYTLEILNSEMMLVDQIVLNSSDNFGATITDDLLRGSYEVGLVADSPLDPEYTLTFATPVSDAPEPGTWALLLTGFACLGGSLRARRMLTKSADPKC